jgi:hypothetical protein
VELGRHLEILSGTLAFLVGEPRSHKTTHCVLSSTHQLGKMLAKNCHFAHCERKCFVVPEITPLWETET